MTRKMMRSALCLVLIVVLAMVPVCASAASKTVQILKVSASGARLRGGPKDNYEVITSLRKGTRVFYMGNYNDAMCKVCTSSGQIGYVYRGYLAAYGAVKKSQIYLSTKSSPLYTRSGSSIRKVGTMPKNMFVLVYASSGNWAYVKNLSGKGAYVKLNALKKAF